MDGIARTFALWKKYNWRLAVPEGQEQLAAHSEASAKRARVTEEAARAMVEEVLAAVAVEEAAKNKGDAAVPDEKPMDMAAMHEVRVTLV